LAVAQRKRSLMSKRWTEEDKKWQEYRRQSALMKVNLPKAPWEKDDGEARLIERSDQETGKADR